MFLQFDLPILPKT